MLNRVNYVAVRNESAKDGRFGKLSIYASSDLTPAQRIAAARELERRGGNPPVTVGGFE